MSKWQTLFRNLFPLAEGIRENVWRRKCRAAAVLTVAALVFSVLDVTPAGFIGNEREALAAYRQGQKPSDKEWFTLKRDEAAYSAERQQIGERQEPEKREAEIVKHEAEPVKSKAASYPPGDYQALLNIVQAEAGGCDSRGKILVANVVLNRVKSELFPNTITDVVYQKSQFSPVSNGSIHQVKVSESTKDCVDRALQGEDYSQGALYFMNRTASQAGNVSWFDQKLTFIFSHGAHEFFK